MTLDKLTELLSENGLTIPVQWNTAKPVRDASNSQWFIGTYDSEKGEYFAKFGDWKQGIFKKWSSVDQGEMNEEERRKYNERMEELEKRSREEREQGWLVAREKVQREWDTFSDLGLTPYLVRKGIRSLYGCRIKANEHGDPILIVPMRDDGGILWNCQRVYAHKLSKGDKFFADCARIEGTFHLLEDGAPTPIIDGDDIFITEGIATAASVASGTARRPGGNDSIPVKRARVVAAFNAGNIEPVARALRGHFPTSRIVICADNDAFNEIPVKGGPPKKHNVGIEKGRAAAQAVAGELRFPVFKYPAKGLSDFNDLAAVQGEDEVYRQIMEPSTEEQENQKALLSKKTRRLNQVQIARDFLAANPYLMKSHGEFYAYDYMKEHWRLLEDDAEDLLKMEVNKTVGDSLGMKELSSQFNLLRVYTPPVPAHVDMLSARRHIANFTNGVLEVVRREHGKYGFDFTPHGDNHANTTKYLMNVIPLECPIKELAGEPPATPLMDAWLERAFGGAADQGELIRATYEAIGSSIIAPAARIFLWHGQPETGKSTIIKLIQRFLNDENITSVAPSDWHGFGMEPMINKLVNAVTDLSTHRSVELNVLKMIFDENKSVIQRKGIKNAPASLPLIHLFAANAIPPMVDLTARALDRRITFIHMPKIIDGMEKDYDQLLFEKEARGILVKGLRAVLGVLDQGGKFTAPASSKETIRDVERSADPVAQFVEDAKAAELNGPGGKILVGKNCRIERKLLWEWYKIWQEDHTPSGFKLGKYRMFQRMELLGFGVLTVRGVRFFEGLGSVVSEDPIG